MLKKPVEGVVLKGPVLTPAQSRMAPAALQWSLEQAGAAAGVSRRTVLRFENGHRDIKPELIAALRRAYEAVGARFLDTGLDAGAVVPPPLRVPPPG
jgi:transcriptional regulator with XRE-family HTH domain